MRSFEERFAAVGRSIDRLIESARQRRPRHYQRRVGPSLREQAHERVERTREFFREGEWKRTLRDERNRRRLALLGATLGLSLLVAVPWWIVRSLGAQPSVDEMVDQAMVRARLEMAAQNTEGGGQPAVGSWGAGPGAGARSSPGGNRWGP